MSSTLHSKSQHPRLNTAEGAVLFKRTSGDGIAKFVASCHNSEPVYRLGGLYWLGWRTGHRVHPHGVSISYRNTSTKWAIVCHTTDSSARAIRGLVTTNAHRVTNKYFGKPYALHMEPPKYSLACLVQDIRVTNGKGFDSEFEGAQHLIYSELPVAPNFSAQSPLSLG